MRTKRKGKNVERERKMTGRGKDKFEKLAVVSRELRNTPRLFPVRACVYVYVYVYMYSAHNIIYPSSVRYCIYYYDNV